MGLIDSHAHLTAECFRDCVPDVLDRAANEGVRHVLSVGTNLSDSQSVVNLARRDERVFAIVGVHPHEAALVSESDWDAFTPLFNDESVVAIGESGSTQA